MIDTNNSTPIGNGALVTLPFTTMVSANGGQRAAGNNKADGPDSAAIENVVSVTLPFTMVASVNSG